jgi:nucleoside-diphosphate-sugar epimerase
MNKPKVMVTGAGGYIGSRLCRVLQQAGFYVVALVRRHTEGPWHEIYCVDLVKDDLDPNFFHNVVTIYHLAGRAHAVSDTVSEDELYRSINVEGTRKLLRSAKQASVNAFLFFSSIKAMNEGGDRVYSEKDACHPISAYGKSKWQAEQDVLLGGYVFHPVVFRLPLVYGENPKGNLKRMIDSIHNSRFPPIPEVYNRRSMIHVDDVIDAAMLATEMNLAKGQIFILTDGHDYSSRQIYDLVRQALGKPPCRWSVPLLALKFMALVGDAGWHITGKRLLFDFEALQKITGSSVFNSEKIKIVLGFEARRDLLTSIKQIVQSMGH